jgi:hypothetical protein
MQTLDIHRPEMPDLQFVLLVTALCTSRLTVLNIPYTLRTAIFDRCWVLIHDSPPPRRLEARVLDLRDHPCGADRRRDPYPGLGSSPE